MRRLGKPGLASSTEVGCVSSDRYVGLSDGRRVKKSRTLWVLIVIFAIAALKTAGSIYEGEDYAWLASLGIGALSYVINVPLLIGEAATAYLLFKQRAVGYLVGSYLILAEALSGLFGVATFALNPEKARAAYIAHRAANGLTTSQDTVQFMTSTQGLTVMALVAVGLWALVYYYLRRIKPELAR